MKRLGVFEIDADVAKKYNEYILKPVTDEQSLALLARMGIKKMFHGEEFYQAMMGTDGFLGRRADFNLIGTIHGSIYKIYFKFLDDDRPTCRAFRAEIREYLAENMTEEQFSIPRVTKIRGGRMSVWRFDWGNILLEEFYVLTEAGEIWNTAIGATSGIVKSAKRIGFLDRVFNRA